MRRIVFDTAEAYDANHNIFIEETSLEEVKAWTKKLRTAYRKRDKKKLREATYQILQWLCFGARIPDCSLRLATYANREGNLGKYCFNTFNVIVYLNQHCWNNFDEYLDTLLHEWVHHYEQMVFDYTDSETKHCLAFEKRLKCLEKQIVTSRKK